MSLLSRGVIVGASRLVAHRTPIISAVISNDLDVGRQALIHESTAIRAFASRQCRRGFAASLLTEAMEV